MRIYISGPISGRPADEARRHFNAVAKVLQDNGHTVINPMDIAHWKLSWASFMKIAFEVIGSDNIDGILMLKGWKNSHGACLERYYAQLNKIPVWYQYGEAGNANRRPRNESAD